MEGAVHNAKKMDHRDIASTQRHACQAGPVPAKRMVAIHFTWFADESLIAAKTAELRKYALEQKLAIVGEPLLAFYNPPWTLPFLRRNEIMLELVGT